MRGRGVNGLLEWDDSKKKIPTNKIMGQGKMLKILHYQIYWLPAMGKSW
jgi:hypothetical protein